MTQQTSATIPAGSVISQNPAAGTAVAPSSAVDLVVSSGSEPVSVPNVVGQSQSAATSTITGAGLTLGTVTQQASTTVPAGTVLSQNPAAGASVAPGTAVDLVVSSGPTAPPPVTVPNVVGQSQSAATSTITGAGLTLGTVTQQASTTVPAGTVLSQNPAAGASVAPGTAVDLVVSSGPTAPPPVTVPNVVGQSQSAATSTITGAGLTLGAVTQQSSQSAPAGSVISQNPAAGASVAPGTAVDLVVSSGPPVAPPVIVPNVVGLSQSAATSALANLGLTATVTLQTSATVPAGNVISQNPAAGASVAPGTAISLVVSSGVPPPQPVTVPNVVGLSQSAATSAITGAGLTLGTVTQQASATVPAGNVLSQNPAAGASVAPGSAVDLVVSSGPVKHLVTATAGPGGSISPPSQLVEASARARFTVTPNSGYRIGSITGCGGDLSGNIYITGPITGDCTVTASFALVPPVSVPNVVGLSQSAATSAITGARLTLGAVTNQNSATVPAGNVISQNPAAGASVAPGTTVNLVVVRDCSYGPDTCLLPYVWREASPADHVCVTVETRSQAAYDNSQAAARRDPNGGAYGPDTCLFGYVWREAFSGDHVCVTGETRSQAAYDNSQANARMACP